jgi:homoserine O-acetyltransferase
MLVQKSTFRQPELLLECGQTLRDVQVGYQTYGKLNSSGDNAILVAHYFSGNSHIAGRFNPNDPEPGYWDQVVGSGKAIDTEKWFVVSSDTLSNLNPGLAHVVTTGPASISPKTGKPYGSTFPVVTIGDFVELQKHLCDFLGIKHLHAVAGPSLGSLQAYEWAARFPDHVSKIIAAIPAGIATEAYLIELVEQWMTPILLDPDFSGGDYYEKNHPARGLAKALELVTFTARHPGWSERLFGRSWADADKNPLHSMNNRYAIATTIEDFARERSLTADANSFLRLCRAVQLFSVRERLDKIRASFLMVPAASDLLMYPEYADRGAQELAAHGLKVERFTIPGDGGHLDGLGEIGRASEPIRRFLETS